jgi:PAS domain S-box-containing protein
MRTSSIALGTAQASPTGARLEELRRYLVAAALVTLAFALKLAFASYLTPPFLLVYPAVVAAAAFGGLGPGLLATALSLPMAAWLVLEPVGSFKVDSLGDFIALLVFALVGVAVSVTAGRYWEARARAEQSEARLAAVVEGSQDGQVDIDVRSGQVYRSPRYWEIAGWPEGSLRPESASFLEPIHPEDAARLTPMAAAILAGEVAGLDEEYRIRTSDGTCRWVRARITVVAREVGGRPRRISGTVRDVDDQHRQAVCSLDEARLRGLSDRINEAELVVSVDGLIVEANQRAAELYGTSQGALRGRHIRALRAPSGHEGVEARLAEAITRGARFETEHLREDGTSFPVEVSSRSFEVGGQRYLHALVRDLTEERWQQAELRLLAAITSSMQDAVVVLDPELKIIRYANAAERLLGWSEAEARGMRPMERFSAEYPDGDTEPHLARIRAGQPSRINALFTRKDGTRVDVEIHNSPRVDAAGQVIGYFAVVHDTSARVAREKALHVVRERLSFVLDGSNDGFWDWNLPSGRVKYSRRFAEIVGHDLAELEEAASAGARLVHPEDHGRVAAAAQCHLAGEAERLVVETRLRHKEGHWVWVQVRGKTVARDAGGKPVRLAGTITDVSERKQAEVRLASAEEKYRSIVTAMAEGVVLHAADGRIIECNEAAERILGLTRAQLEGLDSFDPRWASIHEDGSPFPGGEHPAMEALRTGQPIRNVTMGIQKPDGALTWIAIDAIPMRNPAGASSGAVVVTFTDITDRRRQTERLSASEAKVRQILTAMPIPVVLSQPGGLVEVNPQFTLVTGYTAADVPDVESWFRRAYPDEAYRRQVEEGWGAALRLASEGGTQVPAREYRITRADGVVRNLLITGVPFGDGQLAAMVDITALRVMESQLAVASRLAALGTLVAGIAHEINNPLAVVMGNHAVALESVGKLLEGLRQGAALDRGEALRRLDEIEEELRESESGGERIKRIVKDLSSIGRPNAPRTRVCIKEVVAGAMRWLPVTLRNLTEIRVEDRGAPDILAAGGQIEQVLVNLLSNAIRASPPGKSRPVMVRIGPGAGGGARLEVIDQGGGIAPDVLGRIFEPFFTTREVGQGTGLGLSICHSIVTAYGGTIHVETKVGAGSTFRVELPPAPLKA